MLDKYPTPWRIGPFGDIWVAGDVSPKSDIASNEAKDWINNVNQPRHVISVQEYEADVARFIVETMNKAYPPA